MVLMEEALESKNLKKAIFGRCWALVGSRVYHGRGQCGLDQCKAKTRAENVRRVCILDDSLANHDDTEKRRLCQGT